MSSSDSSSFISSFCAGMGSTFIAALAAGAEMAEDTANFDGSARYSLI